MKSEVTSHGYAFSGLAQREDAGTTPLASTNQNHERTLRDNPASLAGLGFYYAGTVIAVVRSGTHNKVDTFQVKNWSDSSMEFELTDFSLGKFMVEHSFSKETVSRVQAADLVFLPSFPPYEGTPRAFQPDTPYFFKFLRKTNPALNVELLENEGEEKIVSLHSFDIWLPVMWVAQEFLLPTIPSLIASYVYERLRGRFTEEKVDIHLNLYVHNEEKGITKHLDFSGPQEVFEKKFGTIDLNRMWGDDE